VRIENATLAKFEDDVWLSQRKSQNESFASPFIFVGVKQLQDTNSMITCDFGKDEGRSQQSNFIDDF
jgi:hypothetical protein